MQAILTTLNNPRISHPDQDRALGIEVDVLDRRRFSRNGLVREILRSAGGYDAVLLDGSVGIKAAYDDLFAAGAVARRRDLPVVLADCTWRRGTWWLDRLACRTGIRMVDDPSITYCVLSSYEERVFPTTWGIDPARVRFTPWCYTLSDADLERPAPDDGTIFAGGNSMRDYDPLLAAARHVDVPVTIAATHEPKGPIPDNVRLGAVPHDRFVELLRGCRVVVVPLQEGVERSAGQQTYLNAMALGKLVIASDSPGARDYIEHRSTGLVVPPADPDAMAEALLWALDPAHDAEVSTIRARARHTVRQRFRPRDYARSVLEVTLDSLRRAA